MDVELISKAAAIDAIVGVTAFPDEDYIKSLCQNPANSEDWLGGVCDAINAVEEVNAVDAVPVVWMEAQIRPYTGDVSDIGKSARNGTIKDLIRRWQKEQEANDT